MYCKKDVVVMTRLHQLGNFLSSPSHWNIGLTKDTHSFPFGVCITVQEMKRKWAESDLGLRPYEGT